MNAAQIGIGMATSLLSVGLALVTFVISQRRQANEARRHEGEQRGEMHYLKDSVKEMLERQHRIERDIVSLRQSAAASHAGIDSAHRRIDDALGYRGEH